MRVNVYIRKEHEETWDKIENKSEWVNDRLEAESPAGVKLSTKIHPGSNLVVTNTRSAYGFCKAHATPLDSRGKCLQKGCKYA